MKRFTETQKWQDRWFRGLTPPAKFLWLYSLDNCDHAGVIDLDFESVTFFSGLKVEEKHLSEISEKIQILNKNKFLILNFVRFQYGKLSEDCKPHKPVFDALRKHGIDHEKIDQKDRFSELVLRDLRKKIIERDDATCIYSGRRLFDWEIVIDHIVPRSSGGTNDPENLVVMDSKLNNEKGTLSVSEFCKLKGFDYAIVSERLSKATKKGFQSLQEKEKEKEKEKEGGAGGKKFIPPTVEELKAFCASLAIPVSDAEYLWHKWEGNGWENGDKKIKSWQRTIQSWKAGGYLPSQRNGHRQTQGQLQSQPMTEAERDRQIILEAI